MPKRCSICTSPQRVEIDEALLAGLAYREAAAKFGHSKSMLCLHKQRHIPAAIQAVSPDDRAAHGARLLKHMKSLQNATTQVLNAALEAGDAAGVLAAVREGRMNVELVGRLTGQLGASSRQATVNNVVAVKVVYADEKGRA